MRRRFALLALLLALPVGFAGCGEQADTGTATTGRQNPAAAETSDDPGESVTDEQPNTGAGGERTTETGDETDD